MRGFGQRGAVRRFNAEPRRSAGTLRTLRPRYLAESLEPRRLLAVSPIGPEFRVNSATANRQDTAAVAADADGDFVVAWTSLGLDGFRDVFAQRYAAGGAAL